MGGKLEAILKGQFYKRLMVEFHKARITYGEWGSMGIEPTYLFLNTFQTFAYSKTFIPLAAGVLHLTFGRNGVPPGLHLFSKTTAY
ncbi:MAG: hypothetical protein PHN78_08125 [Dehalococcoidales bacterium]|nr:hypothetical protein [Dehalococcoidales bacterium]